MELKICEADRANVGARGGGRACGVIAARLALTLLKDSMVEEIRSSRLRYELTGLGAWRSFEGPGRIVIRLGYVRRSGLLWK